MREREREREREDFVRDKISVREYAELDVFVLSLNFKYYNWTMKIQEVTLSLNTKTTED